MENLPARFIRFATLRRTLSAMGFPLAVLGAVIVSIFVFQIQSLMWALIFGIVITRPIWLLWNAFTLTLARWIVYRGDREGAHEESEEVLNHIAQIQKKGVAPQFENLPKAENINAVAMAILEKSDTQVGLFKDTAIYDWMRVRTPENKILRCTYSGIFNGFPGDTIPEGHIMFPPGIIYYFEEE